MTDFFYNCTYSCWSGKIYNFVKKKSMLKNSSVLFLAFLFLIACSTTTDEKVTEEAFGAKISTDGALPIQEMVQKMGTQTKFETKVSGRIVECCQKKGCWMKLDKGDGSTMMVRFKDYDFFVPKDAAGKTAIMDGFAFIDTISVEDRQHYAKDAGKSEDEIKLITEPELVLAYEATGVIIRDEIQK